MQQLEQWPIERFVEYARNPRKNDHAVDKIAAAIREFGFRVPMLAKSDGTVVDGHLRLKGAKKLGLKELPVLLADDMTPAQVKAFRISVNRMADLAEWDTEFLAVELDELRDEGFDLGLLGWERAELNDLIGTPNPPPPPGAGIDYEEHFAVLVACDSEAHQQEVFEKLQAEGHNVKVLVN